VKDEDKRHLFEIRYWLRATQGKKDRVDRAMERVAEKRGQKAADRLRQGMRDEYLKQRGKV